MGKKRRDRGQRKGDKGHSGSVQCSKCGCLVPMTKAKKVYRRPSFIDGRLAAELRKQGAYIPSAQVIEYLCISCAVRSGRYSPRTKNDRQRPYKKERR